MLGNFRDPLLDANTFMASANPRDSRWPPSRGAGALISQSKDEPISAFVVAISGTILCFAIATIGWGTKLRSTYKVRDAKDPTTRNSAEWPKGFVRVAFILTLTWILSFAAVSMNWSY